MRKTTRQDVYGCLDTIHKWEQIKEGMEDLGSENCPFCIKYVANQCCGCPIHEISGMQLCLNTPYINWHAHQEFIHGRQNTPFKREGKCCDLYINREINYLKAVFRQVLLSREF